MRHLGLLDISGIQAFILRTDKLTDIAAASAFIENLVGPGGVIAAAAAATGATVIMSAGGNAAAVAHDEPQLRDFFRQVSRRIIECGRPLDLVTATEPYDGTLAAAYLRALTHLERNKLTQPRSVRPALAGLEPEAPPLPRPGGSKYTYALPADFDRIVCECSGEQTGMLAVVSIDGIAVGSRARRWLIAAASLPDSEFAAQLGAWSSSLRRRWTDAWDAVACQVATAFQGGAGCLDHPILKSAGGKPRQIRLQRCPGYGARGPGLYAPFRHIYQGGDDLTFVADAHIGLAMTVGLCRELARPIDEDIPECFTTVPVSAGIAYVDARFPFARARRIADDVRRTAKFAAVRIQEVNGLDGPPSAISWWVNQAGAPVAAEDSTPSRKPYLVDAPGPGAHTTNELEHMMDKTWRLFSEHRSFFKQLARAAASAGRAEAVRPLLALRRNSDPDFLEEFGYSAKTGFDSAGQTALCDVAELFDVHFPIEPLSRGGSDSAR